jgi:hypothetical protein
MDFRREAKDLIRTAVNAAVGTAVTFAVNKLLESLFAYPVNLFGSQYALWGIGGLLFGLLSNAKFLLYVPILRTVFWWNRVEEWKIERNMSE